MEKLNNEVNVESQLKQIAEYLKKGYSITPLEALRLFGCMRLGARIHDLRERMNINTELIQEGRKRFAKYTLIQDKQLELF